MGNYNTIQGGKGYVKRSKRKKLAIDYSLNKPAPTHDGIKSVMADNLCNFSTNSELCICMVTWNMNGQVSYEDLVELFGNNRGFDLLVVGLQEVPRKDLARLLQDALVDTHERVWRNEEKKERGSGNQYQLQRTQVGVYHLSSLCSCSERRREKFTVPAHIALSVFQVLQQTLHQPRTHHRMVGRPQLQAPRHQHRPRPELNTQKPSQSQSIFLFLGELLRSKDQLLQEAERGQIFNGYCEGTLAFKPTYKYNIGSSNYDTSYKVRVPAWTDRILFKIEDPNKITANLHCYESVDDIYSSDHKPVRAHLCLKVHK
ncbi:hypothetical protein GOBAR_AA02711 [Gossypium barbadense]|uniref:Inositol polyphosphate-related phosphatase domain-containing protein n=1 Tax=Gossypium barbadense TaxID=3634 RepID=A0A2P5YQM9_GOSBA|nr:hypothetical protein GOBAR_AA02711 [Gossypium barbadense]